MKYLLRWIRSASLFLLLLTVQVSCNKTDPQADNAFRNMLTTLDWGDGVCHVYGHKTPDSDAVCSSLAYAALMRELGYNCEAYVSSRTNNETNFISSYFGFDLPEMKSSVPAGTRLIVTDHEEYTQSVDGARDGRVLQIIDHHQEGDMVGPDTYIYRKMVGSTCTLVWELYGQADVTLSDETARILLAGLLSDSGNLKKSNGTDADVRAWSSLTTQLGLGPDEVEEIYGKMEDAYADYSGMSDYEIFLSDYKDYDISGVPVGIGCVEWRDYTTAESFLDRMLAVMPQALADLDRSLVFCLITRYEPGPDGKAVEAGTYILYCGDGAREIAEEAYGPSLREGVCYNERRLSRKTDVIPTLQDVIDRKANS